jgi:hypothetical protein
MNSSNTSVLTNEGPIGFFSHFKLCINNLNNHTTINIESNELPALVDALYPNTKTKSGMNSIYLI